MSSRPLSRGSRLQKYSYPGSSLPGFLVLTAPLFMIALTGDYGGQTYGIASGALTVTGPVGVTISGTVYGADGVTPVGAGVEVDLSVDSGMVKFTTTDANGAF